MAFSSTFFPLFTCFLPDVATLCIPGCLLHARAVCVCFCGCFVLFFPPPPLSVSLCDVADRLCFSLSTFAISRSSKGEGVLEAGACFPPVHQSVTCFLPSSQSLLLFMLLLFFCCWCCGGSSSSSHYLWRLIPLVVVGSFHCWTSPLLDPGFPSLSSALIALAFFLAHSRLLCCCCTIPCTSTHAHVHTHIHIHTTFDRLLFSTHTHTHARTHCVASVPNFVSLQIHFWLLGHRKSSPPVCLSVACKGWEAHNHTHTAPQPPCNACLRALPGHFPLLANLAKHNSRRKPALPLSLPLLLHTHTHTHTRSSSSCCSTATTIAQPRFSCISLQRFAHFSCFAPVSIPLSRSLCLPAAFPPQPLISLVGFVTR